MTRHLNLVPSDFEQLEKNILPRFPFCYLTFKCSNQESRVFEVKDISKSGMQICLKNGDHQSKAEDQIEGTIQWTKNSINISGQIKWVSESRIGVEFTQNPNLQKVIEDFLTVTNFSKSLKPIHKIDYGVSLPAKLKVWLRADGPCEVFVWQHSDGEISRFQIILMENYLEWSDGEGLKTGRVISKRDVDTPLVEEDEFVFKIDQFLNDEVHSNSQNLVSLINDEQIDQEILSFLKMKLRL